MDAWVVSDHDDLTNRIRKSLDRLGVGCASVSGTNTAAVHHSGVCSAGPEDVILYASETPTELTLA